MLRTVDWDGRSNGLLWYESTTDLFEARAIASEALPASVTSNPAREKMRRSSLRMLLSSSTIRLCGSRCGPPPPSVKVLAGRGQC
jgi:hypothetical protein